MTTRLSHNELSITPSQSILKSAYAACQEANRYPEGDAYTLRQALAKHHQVETDWIVAAGGSAAIIQQVMLAAGRGEVIFAWPSFDAVPFLARGTYMTAVMASLKAGAPDLDDIQRRITRRTKLIIICTPNAPIGGVVSQKDLVRFLEKIPTEIMVLIDEAYFEFVQDTAAAKGLMCARQYKNVVVSRTFSKAYGLAGFRVGYAMAQPALAKKLMLCGVPFSVPLPAQAAALQALADHKKHMSFVDVVLKERERLATLLRGLDEEVHTGHGNFVWLPVGRAAETITKALAEYGILIKAFQPDGVRITVGSSADTDKLIAAWRSMRLNTGGGKDESQ